MPKITPKRRVLYVRRLLPVSLAVFGVFSLLILNVRAPKTAYATAASTVNFQARLQSNTGAIVPDGYYNVEFNLYDASSGGTLLWTEDYTSTSGSGGTDARIQVADGYLSTALGSINPFPGTIDWSQQLYLTMNIGGTGTGVQGPSTTYPTGWDGEMSPRLALTATPYAFDSGKLGGLTASQFGQLAANNTWTGTNDIQSTSSTALEVQQASGGASVFTVDTSSNNITLGSNTELVLQGSTAYITNPQGQSNSEAFGASAVVSGADSVSLGEGSTSGSSNDVTIGQGSSTGGANSVTIGEGATTTGSFSTAIGASSNAVAGSFALGGSANAFGTNSVAIGGSAQTGGNAIAIGNSANANGNSIAFGANAATTGANQLVIGGPYSGGSGGYINNAYIGSGVTDTSPQSITLNATGGSGTNVAGADLNFAGGIGTGNANGGDINLQVAAPGTSGTSANSLSTVASIHGDTGAAIFKNSVDSTAAFQIQNTNGTGGVLLNADTSSMQISIGGDLSVAGADQYNTLNYITTSTAGWFTLGTLTLPQNGFNAEIKIYAGAGYNADVSQDGYVDLFIRTSNGSDVDANGFAASAFAEAHGQSKFISSIKLVSNNAGTSATTYTVYADAASWIGSGFYTVQTNGGSWVDNIATASDPGVGSSTVLDVPFQDYFQDDLIVQNSTGDNILSVDTAASTVTIGTTANGGVLTNDGATLNTAKNLGNFGSSGSIGSAASTVDIYTSFVIPQTAGSISLTVPSPTDTTAGRVIYIANTGSATVTVAGITLGANDTMTLLWNGSAWTTTAVSTGVSVVGSFSSTSIANGASISGNIITFGAADGTNPGMVTTGTQSFAGAKTFSGGVTVSGATLQANAGLSATGGTIALGTASGDTVTIGNSSSTNVITLQGNNITQKLTGASSNPTDIIKGNSTGLFQVQSSSSTVFIVDTTNGAVGINKTPGAGYALDVNGVVNSNTGLDVNGTPVCTTACTPSPGSGNYIQNGTSFPAIGENIAIQTVSASSPVAVFRGYDASQSADLLDIQAWNGTSVTHSDAFGADASLAIDSGATSGSALGVTANGLTTGYGANVTTTSKLQTAGSVLNVSSNVTLDSGASSSFSGQLVNVSRNLTANKTGTAGGTPTLDNSGTYWQNANSSPDYSVRYTVNPGHSDYYLLVNVFDENDSLTAPTSVYYGGVKMTLINSTGIGGTSTADMWLYGLTAPATGTHTLVVNNAQSTTYMVTASSWYNVNQTTPYGSYTAARGTSGLPTQTATVTAGHVIVENMVAVVSAIPCNDAPSGTGQVLVTHNCANLYADNISTFDLGASYKVSTGGSQTLSWSGTSGGADGSDWGTQWTDLIGDSGTTSVLGDNTTGGTADNNNSHTGNYQCSLFTNAYSGTISSISAQFGSVDTTYKSAQAAIYRANAAEPGYSAQLGSLLGSSTTTTLANGANSFTLTSPVTVSAGVSYWLCVNSQAPMSLTYWSKDTVLTNTSTSPALESVVVAMGNNTFGTWPSALGAVMDYSNGYQIYATVTPLGSVGTGVSGAVATFSNNCTVTSGSCMDGSNVLQLTQQFTGATGAVLNIQNAGTGDMIDMVSGGATVASFGSDGSLTFGGSLTGSTDTEWTNGTSAGWNYPTYTVSTKALSYALDYQLGGVGSTSYTTTFNITGLPDVDGTVAFVALEAQKTSGTGVVKANLTINGLPTTTGGLASIATPATSGIENSHKNVTVTRIAGKWFVMGSYSYTNTSSTDPITAADYAEWISYSGTTAPQPGEVLTVGDNATSVKDSATPYDSHIIGVVSTNPYQVGGQDDGHSVVMALTGRVPVKVSLENGPIEPGDPLTSSSTPGVAMKATRAGQIIGTALEAYDGTESTNEINVQLHPGYNNSQPGQIQGDANIGGGLYVAGSANIEGDLTVAGTTTTQNLQVSGDASLATLNVSGGISADSVAVVGQVSAATLAVSGNATFGGDVTVGGHFITAGTAPTTAVNTTDAGSTATCTVAGNDTSGTITLQSQGTGQASGAECVLTFNKPFGSAPRTVLSPNDSVSGTVGAYLQSTPTTMTLNFTGVPADGTTYNFNYFAPQ